jgi:hypothetical protein
MKQTHSILYTIVTFVTWFTEASARLKWGNCSSSDPPRLQCAQLEVPLNWAEPNGVKITLGIARLKVADHRQKIGSLFYNPGGPGGSASADVISQASGEPLFSVCIEFQIGNVSTVTVNTDCFIIRILPRSIST